MVMKKFNYFQRVSKHPLKVVKPPADVTESERSTLCMRKADSGRNYAKAKLITVILANSCPTVIFPTA